MYFSGSNETQSDPTAPKMCVDQCNIVSFTPIISSSRLDYVDGFETSEIVLRGFETGLETRSRIHDDDFANFLDTLTVVSS